MPPSLQGTNIGHARIRAAGADAASVSAGCGTLLASLDLEPPAMPPHAILCVRTMRDPLPDAIDVRPGRPRQRPLAWESAMRAALGMMLRRAARPIDGPVAPDADAVLFADEAEMLACAARDVCRGPLSWFWWWRHLFPESSFERVAAAWRDAPTYMPAAFESLIGIDAALSWTQRLPPSSAALLLDATLRAHALPALADEIASASREVESPGSGQRVAPVSRTDKARPSTLRAAPRPFDPAPPWRGAVPSEWEAPSLPLVSRTFAAMCIVLRRSPWLPRTEGFARAVGSYLREARLPKRRDREAVEDIVRRDDVSRQPPATPSTPRSSGGAPLAESRRRASDTTRRTITTGPFADVTRTSDSDDVVPLPVVRRPSTSRHERTVDPLVDPGPVSPSSIAPLARPGEATRGAETTSNAEQRALASIEGVESDYAGAFFLINVALNLELFSHGITVVDDLELGVWRFIELVARELLGEHDVDDGLWALLESLAERAGSQTGEDRDPDLSPAERVALVARVRTHLEALLDVVGPGGFLIRLRGRIARTPGHLDVHFPLERHPIEIRLARLDRNPGWIPAAGVHVGFHFD